MKCPIPRGRPTRQPQLAHITQARSACGALPPLLRTVDDLCFPGPTAAQAADAAATSTPAFGPRPRRARPRLRGCSPPHRRHVRGPGHRPQQQPAIPRPPQRGLRQGPRRSPARRPHHRETAARRGPADLRPGGLARAELRLRRPPLARQRLTFLLAARLATRPPPRPPRMPRPRSSRVPAVGRDPPPHAPRPRSPTATPISSFSTAWPMTLWRPAGPSS